MAKAKGSEQQASEAPESPQERSAQAEGSETQAHESHTSRADVRWTADEHTKQTDVSDEPEMFERSYVEELRREAAEHRTRARRADELHARLLDAVVRQGTAGILTDASDLRAHVSDADLVDDDGLPDEGRIKAAAQTLLQRKPHLADRRPQGSIDQGAREEQQMVNLADMLRAQAR